MKNEHEELKKEFIESLLDILKKEPCKSLYKERVVLAFKRQQEYKKVKDNTFLHHPENAESFLTDFAYAVLDSVLKGKI